MWTAVYKKDADKLKLAAQFQRGKSIYNGITVSLNMIYRNYKAL